MADHHDHFGSTHDPQTIREWARKTHMRQTMRTEALTAEELRTLDERLARWTTDHQLAGRLPPDWELDARKAALQREARNRREEARPFFTPEEQRAVDASRAAAALRDRIDRREDYGPALRKLATHHMVVNGVGELDACKDITDRFAALYGRGVSSYVQEQRQPTLRAPEPAQDRLFPPELGWDRYESGFRRLVAYDALLFMGRRDGALTPEQHRQQQVYRDLWVRRQTQRGRMPSIAEQLKAKIDVPAFALAQQKEFGRRETHRALGPHGSYWRKVDELAGYVRNEIDSDRRYARALDDHAVAHAAAYGRPVEGVKRDIEERFATRYLDSPAEYLEARLEEDKQRPPDRQPDGDRSPSRPSRSDRAKGRNRDDGRER